MAKKRNNHNPLTLAQLAQYNQEVLFPYLKENFISKKEFAGFKDKTTTSLDKILKKLDILLTEKGVAKYQEEKQKKLWAIIIKSLNEHQILSPREMAQIAALEIF
jgi:hypothetical protein